MKHRIVVFFLILSFIAIYKFENFEEGRQIVVEPVSSDMRISELEIISLVNNKESDLDKDFDSTNQMSFLKYEKRKDESQSNILCYYPYYEFEDNDVMVKINSFIKEKFVEEPKKDFDPEIKGITLSIDYTHTLTGDVLEVYKTWRYLGAPHEYINEKIIHINTVTGDVYTLENLITSKKSGKVFFSQLKDELVFFGTNYFEELPYRAKMELINFSIEENGCRIIADGENVKTVHKYSWEEMSNFIDMESEFYRSLTYR